MRVPHCEANGTDGRTVTLKVKYADFQLITRSRTVGAAISAREEIKTLARSLLAPLFPTAKGIRLIGITVSSLDEVHAEAAGQAQLTFL